MTKIQILVAIMLFGNVSLSQDLYDISNITEIEITFSTSDWDNIMDTYYANDLDELLYGSCVINGVAYDSVGVAFKGNSTYSANNSKNPLKIKLAEVYNQDHQNYQTLKLSSGKNDPSFVREVLSYEIGRQYMDMPLSNYAKVTINGDYYGLFSSSESINGDFMESRFYCDNDNTRIKCNPASVMGGNGSSLMYLGADSSLYFDYYELKSDFGWNELVDICYNIENNLASIETYLDVDRALWMLAFNNVLSNLDSYTGPFRQNFYLIQDDNGRIFPIIWDLNESIGGFEMVNSGGGPPTLVGLTEMDPYIRETDNTYPLIYYLFSNPRYRKMYLAHCRTMVSENLTSGDYYTRAQALQSIIGTEVQNDPNAIYTYSEFTSNLDNTVGSGPGGTFGVDEVLSGREAFLSAHADFNLTEPTITTITNSPTVITANIPVTFTADIQDATYAYFGYRYYKADSFQKIEMFDDGAHGDGAAADGVWGVSLTMGASDMQYYIYAENADAGKFSPVRAEHEFYELTLSSTVVINEIMPSNNETASDQDGEFNDWIELYNNTSSTIDISGYHLSDSVADPTKWVFPDGTTIGANDYLIVWADNDILQTGLHANFKLSSGGETIVFSDELGLPINTVTYPEVLDNGTYGRYPNGTGGFIPMVATHDAENSYTTVSLLEEELQDIVLFPNPTSDYFQIQYMSDVTVDAKVFDLQGRLIHNQLLSSNEVIQTSSWEKGVYIVYIQSLNWTEKVIVR
jgi:hypothetical protein